MSEFHRERIQTLSRELSDHDDDLQGTTTTGSLMSRRDSRVSLNVRQTDALLEFENFKKKFLLANKHITKLNSTLSVRIEELNAQVSILCTENLRLRASEISLTTQLKQERDNSRRLMDDVQAAAQGLSQQFMTLRTSYNVPFHASTPTPSPPRVTQRPINNQASSPVQGTRLSRPPNVPGIYEDDEPSESSQSSSVEDGDQSLHVRTSPRRKSGKTPKARLSASRLPLPSRSSTPPIQLDLSAVDKESSRRPARRASGLIVPQGFKPMGRPPSPIFGLPDPQDNGAQDYEEEIAAFRDAAEKIRKPSKLVDPATDEEILIEAPIKRKKSKRDPEQMPKESLKELKPKGKLQDVTNTRKKSLEEQSGEQLHPARTFLIPSPPRNSHMPTPPPSSSPGPASPELLVPPPLAEEGPQRRTRGKSVNYAEPKLNTKMRKPDPAPGTSAPSRKRVSTSAATYNKKLSPSPTPFDEEEESTSHKSTKTSKTEPVDIPLPSSRPSSSTSTSSKRHTQSKTYLIDDETDEEQDEGAEADAEYVAPSHELFANVDGRRRGLGSRRAGASSMDDRRHSMAV